LKVNDVRSVFAIELGDSLCGVVVRAQQPSVDSKPAAGLGSSSTLAGKVFKTQNDNCPKTYVCMKLLVFIFLGCFFGIEESEFQKYCEPRIGQVVHILGKHLFSWGFKRQAIDGPT
jgi:hypothetical protein